MKLEVRLFREDKQQWAYSDIEIDDMLIDRAVVGKAEFIAENLVPFIIAMQELD